MTELHVPVPADSVADEAMSGAVTWKIHPAIGVARVGNSPTEFFIGGERPVADACHPLRDAGDADNLFLPRIKRQAVRFRIFAYDASGRCLGVVTAASVQEVQWTVSLANRKASGQRTGVSLHGNPSTKPRLRNKKVTEHERWRLEITPQPRHVHGKNQRAVFDDGRFMDNPVCLGEIRTDSDGHLIVLGGFGKSGTNDAGKRIRSCTDNDGWHDDIADGPVCATIILADGRKVTATPSWVIVGPPDFAPGLSAVATCYDVLVDQAIRRGLRQKIERPSFERDIAPILSRIAHTQWLDGRGLAAFGSGAVSAAPDIVVNWAQMARNDGESRDVRHRVFDQISTLCYVVPGTDAPAEEERLPTRERWLALTRCQYEMLGMWAAGAFEPDWSGQPVGVASQAHDLSPEQLDREALEGCAGDVLSIDPEALGALTMPGESFRLDHGKLAAGDMTRTMACPWQAGFLEAGTSALPALLPRDVLTGKTITKLQALDAQIAALPTDGSEAEQLEILGERRRALWAHRDPWTRGLPAESPAREESLVKEWAHLGFVTSHAPHAAPLLFGGTPCFLETARNAYLGSMGEYFHWLVNIEAHRDFTPKALEIALGMLADAKFSAAARFAPFRYTPDTFDERLDKIYNDLVDTVMYKPVPWESGDITWEAVVDYDEDGEPIWQERRFHLGPFSDRALKERFRQFGPLNLTDGAWLQNILPAGPVDGVRARLFSIWLDEAGNGRPELNHSNVYDTLLRSLNIYMPPVTSRDFIELDFVPSAFESPVFQLCLALFPKRFLPELLGLTLLVEWEATPTMEPIGKMMSARNIDPQFYRMHAAIDNIDVGHGALAKEAIKLYLHEKELEGGDALVQEHWHRIWRGYVAWSTLGNGADEIVTRMMLVDKKQIHLRSALLLHDDILPPLLLALQSAEDALSEFLRSRLNLPTRTLLNGWNPSESPSRALLDSLCKDLNTCLRAGIYTESRFASVPLAEPTRMLLRRAPLHGAALIDLSRALLEDAYPHGIARRNGFPDVKAHYRARAADLVRRKTQLALQVHRRKPWLTDAFHGSPEQLLQTLRDRGLVDIEHPTHSKLLERLEFSGPMYKVFTDEEREVLMDWIESLRADGASVSQPLPAIPTDVPTAVFELLVRRAASIGYVRAHDTAYLTTADERGTVKQWFDRGAGALMHALRATRSMVRPGDPDGSPFLRLISDKGPMAGVFSRDEIALVRAWIEQGAQLPGHLMEDGPKSPDESDEAFGEKRWRIGMGAVH